MELETLKKYCDPKAVDRLISGLESIENPPKTIGEFVAWTLDNDATELPGFGAASLKKVLDGAQAAITANYHATPRVVSDEQLDEPEPAQEQPEPVIEDQPEPEQPEPVVVAPSQPGKSLTPYQELMEQSYPQHSGEYLDAVSVLIRRLGIGFDIADRLIDKLTDDECVELIRAYHEGDHDSWSKLMDALRFRPRIERSEDDLFGNE